MRNIEVRENSLGKLEELIYIKNASFISKLNVVINKVKRGVIPPMAFNRWSVHLRSVNMFPPTYDALHLYIGSEKIENSNNILVHAITIENKYTQTERYNVVRLYLNKKIEGTVLLNSKYISATTGINYDDEMTYLFNTGIDGFVVEPEDEVNSPPLNFFKVMGFDKWEGNAEYCKYIVEHYVKVTWWDAVHDIDKWWKGKR